MWQRGKRHLVQVYRRWRVAPIEEAGSSSVNETVETKGDPAASISTADQAEHAAGQSSQKTAEVYDNSEAKDPYFKQSPLISDTSVRKKPRKVVSSHGCLLCFGVLCPILLITAAVIMKTTCNKLRYEHENRVPASCRLTQVEEVVNQTTWCECGYCKGRNDHEWRCLTSYPCYVINVTYVTADVTGPATLSGINSSTPCSIDLLKDCYIEPEMNRKLVEEEVIHLHKISPAIECVHDKENTRIVHLAKDYKIVTYTSIVHCYFWPAVLIALSLGWMLAVGYDTISTVRASYRYATWRNAQSPTYRTPSVSDDSYDGTQEPASWLARMKIFLQDQINKERDEMDTAKRAKLLREMRVRSVMLTESGRIFYRPGHGFNITGKTTTPSRMIQGILNRDAEGVVKRAQLDEPFVDSAMATELNDKWIMEDGSYVIENWDTEVNHGEVNTDTDQSECRDSVFETKDVFSVTSLP